MVFGHARNVHIECTEGMVWVTVEGQPGDFILAHGERLRLESDGLALVQGLSTGAVRLVDGAICAIHKTDRLYWYTYLIELLPGFVRVNR